MSDLLNSLLNLLESENAESSKIYESDLISSLISPLMEKLYQMLRPLIFLITLLVFIFIGFNIANIVLLSQLQKQVENIKINRV